MDKVVVSNHLVSNPPRLQPRALHRHLLLLVQPDRREARKNGRRRRLKNHRSLPIMRFELVEEHSVTRPPPA